MTSELMSLTWVAALHLVMWVPYILNAIAVRGLVDAVGYPDNAAGISNETTVLACQLYFWARVVHLVVYTFGVPWVRTLSFAVGWLCMVALALQLL